MDCKSGGIVGSDIITLFPTSQTLFGKQVKDLVGEDIEVRIDGSVHGTLHYVTDYEEFSSSGDEQSGYYFPLKISQTGENVTCIKNGTNKKTVTYDSDWVLRVSQGDTFEFFVDDEPLIKLNFDNATFEPGKVKINESRKRKIVPTDEK